MVVCLFMVLVCLFIGFVYLFIGFVYLFIGFVCLFIGFVCLFIGFVFFACLLRRLLSVAQKDTETLGVCFATWHHNLK